MKLKCILISDYKKITDNRNNTYGFDKMVDCVKKVEDQGTQIDILMISKSIMVFPDMESRGSQTPAVRKTNFRDTSNDFLKSSDILNSFNSRTDLMRVQKISEGTYESLQSKISIRAIDNPSKITAASKFTKKRPVTQSSSIEDSDLEDDQIFEDKINNKKQNSKSTMGKLTRRFTTATKKCSENISQKIGQLMEINEALENELTCGISFTKIKLRRISNEILKTIFVERNENNVVSIMLEKFVNDRPRGKSNIQTELFASFWNSLMKLERNYDPRINFFKCLIPFNKLNLCFYIKDFFLKCYDFMAEWLFKKE